MDPSVRTTIEQRLVESGEKERLKEHLKNRLTECGWREELKLFAKEIVQARRTILWLQREIFFNIKKNTLKAILEGEMFFQIFFGPNSFHSLWDT